MSVYLISQTYLKEKSIINDNTDYQIIIPIIEVVQDQYIRPLLGTDLFNALKTQITAYVTSATPIPTNYKYLLDEYIQKCMHWYIVAKAGNVFKFRYMNKGVMTKSSDNSQPIETTDLKYITQEWTNYAEKYAEDMTKYLKQNYSLFPELNTNTTYDKDRPAVTGFDSPFYFENEKEVYYDNRTNFDRNNKW